MPPEIDLLAVQCGSVTAPAGCGKTQLIAESLLAHQGASPILILTHTNAGVSALRVRLRRAGVLSSSYRISTIDGFAMRLIAKFPLRSGHDPQILLLQDPRHNYPAIREAAQRLLRAGHLNQALVGSYARVLVDEYQDCNVVQHAIVSSLAEILPTCVLGDPMQAIFDLPGNLLVHWENDVLEQFPHAGALQTPWRWRRAGADDLGNWLLVARNQLSVGAPVDLRTAPQEVQWVELNAGEETPQRLRAARTATPNANGTVLVIGDSMNATGRHLLTSQTPGAMAVEAVEMRDLVNFARQFDVHGVDALTQLLGFASKMMTGVRPTALRERVVILQGGRQRNPPSAIESTILDFVNHPTWAGAIEVLQNLAGQPTGRVYRPEILSCCYAALQLAESGITTFHAAAIQSRERNRHAARPIARRAIGSTLLLKGLEADVCVILEPELMTAQNLYVALTRGARRVIVCSETPILTPVVAR